MKRCRCICYNLLERIANSNATANVIVSSIPATLESRNGFVIIMVRTSAAGLQGIYATTELPNSLRLVRPMLDITRTEVLEHCAQYQLAFAVIDSSNLSLIICNLCPARIAASSPTIICY
ncbi:MAG: ATP-binding protein [Blastocatellia bacterium]